MFTRTSLSTDSALPLRGYILSVGGVLIGLLLLTNWMLPPQLPPHEPDPVRPTIRIHTEMKPPERLVIDTNQSLPAPSGKEISVLPHSPAAGD
jgi:hypothetical protein